jgi:hypothetical protein
VSQDAPYAYAVALHGRLVDRLSANMVTRVTQVAKPSPSAVLGWLSEAEILATAGLESYHQDSAGAGTLAPSLAVQAASAQAEQAIAATAPLLGTAYGLHP